jgi:hypothetical protein
MLSGVRYIKVNDGRNQSELTCIMYSTLALWIEEFSL